MWASLLTMQMYFKGSSKISRETSGSGMFFVQLITMVSALFLLRRAILGQETETNGECLYGTIMLQWLEVSGIFALAAIICQFSVSMRYGNNLDYQYYVFCARKSYQLYQHHVKSKGSIWRFGRSSSEDTYKLDPKIDSNNATAEVKDVLELEPCQRNLCQPRLLGLLAFFLYLDLVWNLLGARTIINATEDNCQDSQQKMYWLMVAICSCSALFLPLVFFMVFVLGFRKDMCPSYTPSGIGKNR